MPVGKEPGLGGPRPEDAKATEQTQKEVARNTRVEAFTAELDLSKPLPDWMSTNVDRAAGFARPNFDSDVRGGQFGDSGGYTETVMGFQDAAWRKVKDSLETMPENQLRTALLAWEHPSKKHSGKTHVAMLETATNAVKAELKRRKDTAAQTSEGKA